MPPFIPAKRSASPESAERVAPSAKRQSTRRQEIEPVRSTLSSSDEEQSEPEWEDVDNGISNVNQNRDEDKDEEEEEEDDDDDDDNDEGQDEDEIDWEDAMATTTTTTTPAGVNTPIKDLELTLDAVTDAPTPSLLDTKKGPSKIERAIRLNTHRMHVQCLLFHNALRNSWINDSKVHDILLKQLPEGIKKEVQRWRVASGLEAPPQDTYPTTKGGNKKSKKKQKQTSTKEWGQSAERLEPGQPDMSHGDPILQLLRILAAYWKKNFKITAPGLRKNGYRSAKHVEQLINSHRHGKVDPMLHGERVSNRDEFRALADKRQGSRDVAAQLFTALLRALGIEARLVSNLQPLGFGWTKAEVASTEFVEQETQNDAVSRDDDSDTDEGDSEEEVIRKKPSSKQKAYDNDLPFPVYWTEAVSPVTHQVIPVDAMVLANQVAATPEMIAAFEPRGARADKAKQVIAYVVAHSSDGTAKDVTTRYLKRRTWPGKTKGYRLPVEKLVGRLGGRTVTFDYDWFKMTMKGYERPTDKRTVVDDIEDGKDLVSNQPERKAVKEKGDTLQSLKASTEFVLERFLRREEALRPGAQVVRTFTTGKGNKAKEENVYRRSDVLKCLSAESWMREGRRPKMGETPLKRVPIRAVTTMRKREVDEVHRQTGQKPLQGLYSKDQTEYIIPPPIQNGVIPKNEYGNIDCFVPSMVPRGAVHVPYSGTVRICKKLGIDYAEAVTGFEFGSKMAVPVIEGVVVAEENGPLLRDAWRADQQARREKERLAQEKRILQTWRKFLMGLRIMERVRAEYGDGGDGEVDNPFQRRSQITRQNQAAGNTQQKDTQHGYMHDHEEADEDSQHNTDNVDQGGGFLLPGDDDGEDNLIVDHGETQARRSITVPDFQDSELSDAEAIEDLDDEEDEEEEKEEKEEEEEEEVYNSAPRPNARRRRRGG